MPAQMELCVYRPHQPKPLSYGASPSLRWQFTQTEAELLLQAVE